MQRKFITNLVFLLLINFLVKPFWIFGIDREVQNILGSESYGEYFVLFNFSLLLNILLDLGITNFNNRNIAQNRQLLSKHFSGILSLKLLLGIIYLLITLFCAFYFQFSAFRIKLLLFLVLNQFLVSFILYLRSNMAALHLFKTDSVISIIDRLLMILFCALLIWGELFDTPLNINQFVYTQTLSYFLTAVIAFVIVYAKAPFQRISWKPPFLLMVLKKSLPFAFLVLLMSFYNRMDSVMLDYLLPDGAKESGLYAQGYRLLDAVNMIGFLTAGLLYPIFSYQLKHQQTVAQLVKLSVGLMVAVSIPVAVLSWVFSKEIIQFLYHEEINYSAQIFQFLMVAFIPVSINYVVGTLLTANGSLKLLNIFAISGVLLNFILNYMFIPTYGAIGSAYTTLATHFFVMAIQSIVVLYIFKFKVNNRFLASLSVFILLSILAGMMAREIGFQWFIQFTFAAIFMLILSFISGLINVKSLLSILKYDKE